MFSFSVKRANTILYCEKWLETVGYYRDKLGLSVTYETDWFVEFQITETAYLSVADRRRATIKPSHGKGITITFEVDDIEALWQLCSERNLRPTPVKSHSWGALQFFLYDPEGHRLEIWQEA